MQQAKSLLQSLESAPCVDSEFRFHKDILEVDFFSRNHEYTAAFYKVEKMAEECKEQGADVLRRIRLLCAKAQVFWKCGKPQKGLSLAVRAVTAAYRAKLYPALWEAAGILAGAMVGLRHFGEARRLVDSVIYQVCGSVYQNGPFMESQHGR